MLLVGKGGEPSPEKAKAKHVEKARRRVDKSPLVGGTWQEVGMAAGRKCHTLHTWDRQVVEGRPGSAGKAMVKMPKMLHGERVVGR